MRLIHISVGEAARESLRRAADVANWWNMPVMLSMAPAIPPALDPAATRPVPVLCRCNGSGAAALGRNVAMSPSLATGKAGIAATISRYSCRPAIAAVGKPANATTLAQVHRTRVR